MTRIGFQSSGSLDALRELYSRRARVIDSLQSMYQSSLPVLSSLLLEDEVGIEMQIDSLRKKLEELDMRIASLIRHEHLNHLQPWLDAFQKHYPNPEKTVFVMMKFSSKGSKAPEDRILKATYKRIRDVCFQRFGLTAVRADELMAAPQSIWQNAQTHALGCSYGIAVLENKYINEFNPNIAMEAGFMEALGHKVLLLIEDTFPYNRADLQGRICESFTWGDSASSLGTISEAITRWFDGMQKPRKPGS